MDIMHKEIYFIIILLIPELRCAILTVRCAVPQDYQVADISCMFPIMGRGGQPEGSEHLVARLRKPPGFKGHPIFADNRSIDPLSDSACQIRPDPLEPSGLIYNLVVHNFDRCSAVRKDGYVHIRVWFPQLPGLVLATDQEVVIMCQPALPTIIENRAAGFAGSLPSQGRVSGVVEESPGRLEYEVALFRESLGRSNPSDNNHALVEQAVPIGTKLQLRARINTNAAWKYAKLIGVTVSTEKNDPFAPGHVRLVKDGCRLPEIASIVPQQPRRLEDLPGEVQLDFEAFMLDSKLAGSSKLWIHATIKACVEAQDCLPEFCLDLFQPSGHGRRRRMVADGRPVLLDVGGDLFSLAYVMRQKRHYESGSNESIAELAARNLQHIKQNIDMYNGRPKKLSQPSTTLELDVHNHSFTTTTQAESFSTSLADNVGVTVIMPDEFFTGSSLASGRCPALLVAAGVLGACTTLACTLLLLLAAKLRRLKLLQASCSSVSVSGEKESSFQLNSKYPSVRYLLQ